MTPDRLEEIQQREKAATDGPWGDDLNGTIAIKGPDWEWGRSICQCRWILGSQDRANLKFIAHAREDIPWLVQQLREARTALEQEKAENAFVLGCTQDRSKSLETQLAEARQKLEQAEAALKDKQEELDDLRADRRVKIEPKKVRLQP